MKKFFFRLETLLKIRKAHEGTIKRELEQLIQKRSQMKEKERMLEGQMKALMEDMSLKRSRGEFSLEETYNQILEHLQSSLLQLQQTLFSAQKQVEEHQERLAQAIQERKVIEKIKEKHYAGWLSRQFQSEGALVDELALKKSPDRE